MWRRTTWRNPSTTSVYLVAQQRMINMRHVHPYLMGTPGFELQSEEAIVLKFTLNLKMRQRMFTLFAHCHFLAILWMARYTRFDTSTCSNYTLSNCNIFYMYMSF